MKNIGKFFLRTALCAAVVCPLMISCEEFSLEDLDIPVYDDTEIKEQIENILDKLDALEQKMNTELKALNDLHKGQLSILDVSTDATTGITTLLLRGGDGVERELYLHPKADMKSFVTYIPVAGVNCWAYVDKDGSKQFFTDKNGAPIPVFEEMPKVIEKDGEAYIVIGGEEYPMGGNSVFSDYELVENELTGEVYAVTFTFGEDMSFTVTVDGKAGFMFVKNMNMSASAQAISDFYVANGLTGRVQIQAIGVVDYLIQVPDGWRVKEYNDEYTGMYFDITAPSKEQVASGAAVSEGVLKVMSVLEGGKASMTKLDLSSEPFRKFGVSLGKADIVMYNGISKFVYGVSEASAFDEAAVFAEAQTLLSANDKGVGTYDIENKPLADLTSLTLTPGNQYVLWAIPAQYSEEDEGYYLLEGTIVHNFVNYSTVDFKVSDATIRDAKLKMDLKGVSSYYFQLLPKEMFNLGFVLSDLNAALLTAKTEPMAYDGSVFALGELKSAPSTEYVAWFAIAETGRKYTESDVLVCEFSTLDLAPGSNVKVTPGTVAAEPLDVKVPLAAEGADMIYYAFFNPDDIGTFADDAAKVKYLIDKGVGVEGVSADAMLSEFPDLTVKPRTDFVLLAVATDLQGKYGEVLKFDCRTAEIPFNEIKVAVEDLVNSPEEMQFKISATGGEAVEYLYWIGKTSDRTWSAAVNMGGTAETAQEYMYINAASNDFKNIASAYPIVDGVISMKDHTQGLEYVLVIMAKDKDGVYSKATVHKFTPRPRNLGNIVYKTDAKWAASNPTIEWIEESFVPTTGWAMDSQYEFYVTIPEGFTAYILCGTDDYLTDGNSSVVLTPEETMLTVMDQADHPQSTSHYDIFYYYQHGDPLGGFITGCTVIWSSMEFHDSLCDCGGNWDELDGSYMGEPGTVHHVVPVNEGEPIRVKKFGCAGSKDEVIDKVFIVCQDSEGNCYETFVKDVPFELFANAKK